MKHSEGLEWVTVTHPMFAEPIEVGGVYSAGEAPSQYSPGEEPYFEAFEVKLRGKSIENMLSGDCFEELEGLVLEELTKEVEQ